MAPEYAYHGHFSIKSDVFSFGVLVLEMICEQKNSYFHNEENGEDLLTYVSTISSYTFSFYLRLGSTCTVILKK